MRLGLLVFTGLAIIAICSLLMNIEMYSSGMNSLDTVIPIVVGLVMGVVAASTTVVLLGRSWVIGLAAAIALALLGEAVWCGAWNAADQIRYWHKDSIISYVEYDGPTLASIFCMLPMMSLAICAPLLLSRARGWRWVPAHQQPRQTKNSIEDILIAMAIIASLVALAQVSVHLNNTTTSAFWLPMCIVLGVAFVLGSPMLIIVPIASTRRPSPEMSIALRIFFFSLACFAVLLLAIAAFTASVGGATGTMILQTSLMGIAASVVLTLGLYSLRALGLRNNSPINNCQGNNSLPSGVADKQVDDGLDESTPRTPANDESHVASHSPFDDESTDTKHANGDVANQTLNAGFDDSRFKSRLVAASIVVCCCVASAIGSNINKTRSEAVAKWSTFASDYADSGAMVDFIGGELLALKVAPGMKEEQIRPLLNSSIRELSLAGALIGDDFVREIAQLEYLDALDLKNTKITEASFDHLSGHVYWTYLGIGGNDVSAKAIRDFCFSRSIGLLDLSGCGFSESELTTIAEADLYGCILTGNDVTDAWLETVANRWNSIDVSNTSITGDFLASLADCDRLVLDSTNITDEKFSSLPAGTEIRHLSIRNTPITLKALQPFLPRIPKITIGEGPLTEADIGFICRQVDSVKVDRPDFVGHQLIASPWQMSKLDVSGTAFDDQSVRDLASSGIGIGTLNLANTNVTDACLQDIAKLSTTEIDISGTSITASGINQQEGHLDFVQLRVAVGQFTEAELSTLRSSHGEIRVGKRWQARHE